MAGNPAIDKAVSGAKSTLAAANKAFPSSMAPKNPAPKPAAAPAAKPASSSMSTGEPEKGIKGELAAKEQNVSEYMSAPKMHNGGPVLADGVYRLKKGEHVLTEDEAHVARKHALVNAGLKSLALRGKATTMGGSQPATSGEPKKPMSTSGKMVKGISVRPEKSQGAKIVDRTKKN